MKGPYEIKEEEKMSWLSVTFDFGKENDRDQLTNHLISKGFRKVHPITSKDQSGKAFYIGTVDQDREYHVYYRNNTLFQSLVKKFMMKLNSNVQNN